MLEWTLEIGADGNLYILRTRGNEFRLTRDEFLKLYELMSDALIWEGN